ncbi:hypothetical protein N826_39125 [Skermanella aerolata KACC 11604]|nr:hypothetical protein N826_39125 [Skermanella aerolata KACC 11604]
MPLVQSGVNAGSVIAAVAHEDLDGLGDTVEQEFDLGGVIDVTLGQDGGVDPAGHRVKTDMQFAPGAPPAGAVFLDQPFARPAQLQSRTVDHEMKRSTGGVGLRRQLQASGSPAEGRELAALALTGSGTGRSRPSRWRIEPINPSVWRSARWNTARNVRAVVIARSE